MTCTHVSESYGFLEGFRRYSPVALPAGAGDAYYAEVRRIAERLGARDVPASETEVSQYFADIGELLRFDERSREVLAVLARIHLPVPAAALSRDVFLGAGAVLLPDWAASRLHLTRAQRAKARVSARALRAMAPLFRSALRDGVAQRACKRVGVDPAILERWP